MDLSFEKEQLSGFRPLPEKTVCQEELLESIVPDACPDIARIAAVNGTVLISDVQSRDGSVSVNGKIQTVTLYEGENGGLLSQISVSLPFTCQQNISGLTESGKIRVRTCLRQAEVKVLNPRKILIRANILLVLTAYQPFVQELCTAVCCGHEENICQLNSFCDCSCIQSVENKSFEFEDQIRLKYSRGESLQVLHADAVPTCSEYRLIGRKLIFKGNASLTFLIQNDSGTAETLAEDLPISQIIEVPSGGEDRSCELSLTLQDFTFIPSAEDPQLISVYVKILACAAVSTHKSISVLEDLYSTARTACCELQPFTFSCFSADSTLPQTVRELIETESEVRSVIGCSVEIGELARNDGENGAELTAEILLSVLWQDHEETIRQSHKTVRAAFRPDQADTYHFSCMPPSDVYAVPFADGIEVRFTVELRCRAEREKTIQMISGASLGELRNSQDNHCRPSLILRLPSEGERLWDIAKAYGTTEEQILRANGLEPGVLPTDHMLLIPSIR